MPSPTRAATTLRALLTAVAPLRYIFYALRDVFVCLRVLLIPACLSGFASLVLFLPDQTRDYYRLVVENLAEQIDVSRCAAVADAVFPIVFLLGMAACLLFSTIVLLVDRNRPSLYRTACVRYAVPFLPILFGTLPLVAAIAGFAAGADAINLKAETTSIDEIDAFGDHEFAKQLKTLFDWSKRGDWYFELGLWVLGAVTLLFLLRSIFVVHLSRRLAAPQKAWLRQIANRTSAASLILSLVAVVVIAAYPVPIGQTLGSISIFAIFIGCLTLNATGLSIWSRRLDFPIIPALLAVAGFLAWTDINDDHELRRIDKSGREVRSSATPTARPPGDIEGEFAKWFDLRPDRKNPEFSADQSYPVYIVAAQGGGIYAAAQAVQFLTKLQTTCERFAQHLFAISGVSGGSVGAAFYAAMTEEFKPTEQQCRSVAEIGSSGPRSPEMREAQQSAFELVRNDYDFLSPLVASALFPDFAQRFFWPANPALSRARALERSIEAAWADVATRNFGGTGRDALKSGVLASWNPAGLKPALFFNTTEVASGRRRVIAPFDIDKENRTDAQILPLTQDYDIPLSVAAVASARFPWLTPAAWFWDSGSTAIPPDKSDITRFHVVDGGYFENSGVTTAVDIINRLQRRADACCKQARFHLIVLTSGKYSEGSSSAFSEAVSPVVALFNSRTARTYSTVDLATRDLGVIKRDATDVRARISRVQRADFGDYVIPLPLGWRLSKMSASEIFFLTGRAAHCVPDEDFLQKSKVTGFGPGDCVQRLILHQLRGDDLDTALRDAQASHPQVKP
ncbi:patatin-like phospholipase family protein [Bradyrhizobium sp. Y36]|uniref:patatin-like phospholipase family protein n=1 Tax=Bradyrhizobium sp. Y36 TaxID=2035447 RepID=UPI001177EE65|nr:patatin-like phospholipase family protein [Bradyrhizobium sp. Y36]